MADPAGESVAAEPPQVALLQAGLEVRGHPVGVVWRQREAELGLTVRVDRLGQVGVAELGEVLVSEHEAEPVAARLGERLGESLWQPAEAVCFIDQADRRRPRRVGAEPLGCLPEPLDDHRADQVGGIAERPGRQ